jgi:RES domain-containing protein
MHLFRLTRKAYSNSLSGAGAAKYGYRWNSRGVEMVYCAESRSLAYAEVMLRLTASEIPDDMCMMEIAVPGHLSVQVLDPDVLPSDWNLFPHVVTTKTFGDTFIRGGVHCLMKVPSAVVQGDFNYLINPRHSDFNQISIAKVAHFRFDRRLFNV